MPRHVRLLLAAGREDVDLEFGSNFRRYVLGEGRGCAEENGTSERKDGEPRLA